MTTGPKIELRPATVADAPALGRIHVDAWWAAYRGLVPDSFLQHIIYDWGEARLRRALAAGSEETYAVELEGESVGLVTLGAARDPDLEAGDTGEVWGIYLAPGHWRRGIGRQAMAEAERMLRARGYERAVLWVLAGNQQARCFYEALGYALDGTAKELDLGRPLTAVRYAKGLTGR
jgi:RimJ/RimL family protein N-acetyltransferase